MGKSKNYCWLFFWGFVVVGCSGTPAERTLPAHHDGAQQTNEISVSESVKPLPHQPLLVTPFLEGTPFGPGYQKFVQNDCSGANALWRKASSPDNILTARKDVLVAWCAQKSGDHALAVKLYTQALPQLPLLAPLLSLQIGRNQLWLGKPEDAVKWAKRVPPNGPHGARALYLQATAQRKFSKAKAIQSYESYLARFAAGNSRAMAHWNLAQLELSSNETKAKKHLRAVIFEHPLSGIAKDATATYEGRFGTVTPTVTERLARGAVYYQAMRNELSEADYREAHKLATKGSAERCEAAFHWANSIYKQRNRRKSAPLFAKAYGDCKAAKDFDLTIKSAYQAGRAFDFFDDDEVAIGWYEKLEKEKGQHSYKDDARLRRAKVLREIGKDKQAKAVLEKMPKLYPTGDMIGEGMWRLGWEAYKKGEYAEAIKWLGEQIRLVPIDSNYWGEGQAQYWIARSYGHLGDDKKAADYYRQAILTYPLSYYALLSLNRLREAHPEVFKVVTSEIVKQKVKPVVSGVPGELAAKEEFQRAMEYLRMGFGKEASIELAAIGYGMPQGKKQSTEPNAEARAWLLAQIYDAGGLVSRSVWVMRWHAMEYKRFWPSAKNRRAWDVAYPRGYGALVTEHTKRHKIPSAMLFGIMREESGFNPVLESYANAIGLTQMIFPTARRFGKGTGIEITRENLRDPVKNVTIGSNFLAFLFKKWDNFLPLIPPSYNAGEGAVTRWLRARGTLPADEWIESIGGDQARRYSKRVLSSFFTYSYLADGKIPVVGNQIPKKLLPR